MVPVDCHLLEFYSLFLLKTSSLLSVLPLKSFFHCKVREPRLWKLQKCMTQICVTVWTLIHYQRKTRFLQYWFQSSGWCEQDTASSLLFTQLQQLSLLFAPKEKNTHTCCLCLLKCKYPVTPSAAETLFCHWGNDQEFLTFPSVSTNLLFLLNWNHQPTKKKYILCLHHSCIIFSLIATAMKPWVDFYWRMTEEIHHHCHV